MPLDEHEPEQQPPTPPPEESGTPISGKPPVPPDTGRDDPEFDDIPEYDLLTPELLEEEALRGDFVLKWAVVLLAFLLGSTEISRTAVLVHLRTGEYLATHRLLPPATDVFSATAEGRPWVNFSWLFDLCLAGIFAVSGAVGLSVAKAALAGVVFWMIVHISRPGLPTWWGAVCAAIALLACHNQFTSTPESLTLLGVACCLWLIHDWQHGGRRLWWLIPVVCLWSNLDPRAFLGLGLLLLYLAGTALAMLWQPVSATSRPRLRFLATVVGLCAVAAAVHPVFGGAWRGAGHLYAVEYPALCAYNADFAGVVPPCFPILIPEFWQHLDSAALAALLLIAVCGLLFVLNFRRLEPGALFVYVGSVVAACCGAHELPVAALVCCVLATLNGQTWYAANCRQTYSLTPHELLFSRGGRVLTVLAFSALAFLGGTGRLRDPRAPRTGYGWDPALQSAIISLHETTADSFDSRPFNFTMSQGDMLIWLNQKPFIDSRVALYRGEKDDDLLQLHKDVRAALQKEGAPEGKQEPRIWKAALDRFQMTHVLPRLSGGNPDYISLLSLLRSARHWQLTRLGAATAVFYRADLPEPKLEEYITSHRVDFLKQAYQKEGSQLEPRTKWVSPPSFYQKYFWKKSRNVPNEVQEGLHFVRLATDGNLPQRLFIAKPALACLAVRSTQLGLAKEPDCVEGYFALGQAYTLLAGWESAISRNPSRSPWSGLRYVQAVSSYNQALVADPENIGAHHAAFRLYAGANRLDLALRELVAFSHQLESRPPLTDNQAEEDKSREEIAKLIEQLRKQRETVNLQLQQMAAQGSDALQMAQAAAGQGYVLRALAELEKSPESLANPEVRKLQALLLLEAGQTEQAYESLSLLEESAAQMNLGGWQDPLALACLANAEYDRAIGLWQTNAEQVKKLQMTRLLFGLPPIAGRSGAPPWPIPLLAGAMEYLYYTPEPLSTYFLNCALVDLERGANQAAAGNFHEALSANPETPNRLLIAESLFQLTGERIEVLPPSEIVPVLIAPEPEEPAGQKPGVPEKQTGSKGEDSGS